MEMKPNFKVCKNCISDATNLMHTCFYEDGVFLKIFYQLISQ